MKKLLVITSVLVLTAGHAIAQKEFKLAKTSGKLVLINIPHLTVEGYDGKEIVFTLVNKEEENDFPGQMGNNNDDPRAKGLNAVSDNGFDNTGLGLAVSEKGQETIVSPIGNLRNEIKIKLPANVALSVVRNGWSTSNFDSVAISLNNIKSEIDLSVQSENCKLSNVTGPLSIKTLSGNIDVKLNNQFSGPISISSVNGFIDVTTPENGKADIEISTRNGTIYADKSLNLKSEKVKQENSRGISTTSDTLVTNRGATTILGSGAVTGNLGTDINKSRRTINARSIPYSGNSSFTGTLNGGGKKIVLHSMNGNIYFRK
ncbi:MAG: DUF4097 family beta strand repeat-containing protein [Ginsengibacter sp.]|jgi:predicted membrane protein